MHEIFGFGKFYLYSLQFQISIKKTLLCEYFSLDTRLESVRQDAVQVYRSKTWYYLCGDSWNMDNTRVACWDLGYRRKSEVDHYFSSVSSNTKIWRNDIECTGKEKGLRECRVKYRPYFKCTRLVHVQCKTKCKFLFLMHAIE